jgi:hypothetical protein
MAQFEVVAEILTSDDPKVKAYHAGVLKSHPGMLLRDILKKVDSDWNTTVDLPKPLRDDIQRVAELSNDRHLLEIATKTELPVSLKHLRDADPDTTWVALGTRLLYTPEESEQLKKPDAPAFDPRKHYSIR